MRKFNEQKSLQHAYEVSSIQHEHPIDFKANGSWLVTRQITKIKMLIELVNAINFIILEIQNLTHPKRK